MAKILFISNIADKVGSFSVASIKAAQELGYEYYYAANWSGAKKEQVEKDQKEFNVHIVHLDLSRNPCSLKNVNAYKQLVELIKKEKIDYIHCNTPTGGVLGRLAGNKCGVKKIIYQAHGFHFYKGAPKVNWLLYYPVEKWLAHKTDALITINQEDYELASRKFHLRANGKVYYVPGVGIDLTQYTSLKEKKAKLRKEIGLEETDIVCIAMGDLIARKNYGIAIETISRLQPEFPTLHFVICGKGPELENLKSLAAENKVLNKIHFLGFRTDIKDLLQAADIFFFTSLQEGLPRSTMEAMASGLPVACSRIRGNTDLVDEENGGVLFNPQDIDDVEKKLYQLLTSDYASKGKYNLDHIREFSLDMATESVRKIYEKEIEKMSGGITSSKLYEFYPEWYRKRMEFGIKATDIVLISAGRLEANKNNAVLIKAVKKINNPKIHLILCGEGEERKKLEQLSVQLEIENNIHLLGNCAEMEKMYQTADIFVMASYREGLSRSIMEAMASGLPCIVSKIRGNVDLVNLSGGSCVLPNDVEGFKNAISKLLMNDEKRKKSGLYNLEYVKKFSTVKVSKILKEIYYNTFK